MKKNKFTLIELLVVIAIIGILVSLLLPSLSKARKTTKELACLSNQKQCMTALTLFAKNNSNAMPYHVTFWALDTVRHNSVNIIKDLEQYESFPAWQCVVNPSKPDIDDPANNHSVVRSDFGYLPSSASRFKQVSQYLTLQEPDDQIIFDLTYTYRGNWRANHSKGGVYKTGSDISSTYTKMPSFGTYFNGIVDNQNVIWADGSGGKRIKAALENVGDSWFAGKKE